MIVLGISAYYHDSAAAIVVNGRVVAAVSEERFTRIKHDKSFPYCAIQYCLKAANVEPNDIDQVCYYEQPSLKWISTLQRIMASYPFSLSQFRSAMLNWMNHGLWVRMHISDHVGVSPTRISFSEHHQSHAAYAYYASSFSSAVVVPLDGVGENICGSIYKAQNRNSMVCLKKYKFPDSLGLFYGAMTGFLGFKPNDQECNVMALAAFGAPTYKTAFDDIIKIDENGGLKIAPKMFDFESTKKDDTYLPLLTKKIGLSSNATFESLSCSSGSQAHNENVEKAINIAASVQNKTEEILIEICAYAKRITGCSNLCLAGGVAQNAVAVSKVYATKLFDDIFIPPAPNDAGSSVGAAFSAYDGLEIRPQAFKSSDIYSGPMINTRGLEELLSALDISSLSSSNASLKNRYLIKLKRFPSTEKLTPYVAEKLVCGDIVGWVVGRAEFGPRSLGARSILCLPSDAITANKLSSEVKHRAAYRPYALSVADTDATKLFNTSLSYMPHRWMQETVTVAPEWRRKIQAALHIDNSTRPHICSEDMHSCFYNLLIEIGKLTGLAALLNTSFNMSGEPLVNTLEDAILMFAQTNMDVLVLEDCVIEKYYEK